MIVFDGLSQLAATHVGVDLGGREVRVSEHHLDRSQICAALQQVRRKGVAQHMGGDAFARNSRAQGELPEQREKILTCHRPAPSRQEQRMGAIVAVPKQAGTSGLEVLFNRSQGEFAEGHHAFMSPLADHPQQSASPIETAQR
jgi:hypothetical protein